MSDLSPVPVGSMNPAVPPALPEPARPPALAMEHRVRVSALEPERVWKLTGDTLWIGTEGQPDIPIPLASIAKVRLAYEPSRMQLNRYRCYLYNPSGKVATIQNEHYKGIASFEDRSAAYTPLIRLLIPRVASLSPHCQFVTGTSYLSWFGNALFLGITGLFLLLAIFFLYTAIGWLVVIKLLIIAFFIPSVVRWFMKNKPRTFNPSDVPESMLPRVQ